MLRAARSSNCFTARHNAKIHIASNLSKELRSDSVDTLRRRERLLLLVFLAHQQQSSRRAVLRNCVERFLSNEPRYCGAASSSCNRCTIERKQSVGQVDLHITFQTGIWHVTEFLAACLFLTDFPADLLEQNRGHFSVF